MDKEIKKISKYSDKDLIEYFGKTDLNILHNMKLYLDDLYYNTGISSGLDDYQYDALKEILEERDPGYIPEIGAKIRTNDNKVDLPFWLGSMNKLKPDDESEFNRWLTKNKSEEYILEDKLDGISCLLIAEGGKLKLYTRGDGKIGSDISYFAQYFKNLPDITSIKNIGNIAIRGELILQEDVFITKYSDEFANPRNFVAGRIGSKTVRDGLKDIEFIAYEIVKSGICLKPEEQLNTLRELGFTVVTHRILPEISIESLVDNLYLSTIISLAFITNILLFFKSADPANISFKL